MKTIIVELRPWQQIAFGAAAVCWGVQTWGGRQIIKSHDDLIKRDQEIVDYANRSAYLNVFFRVKLAESGIELTEFEEHIVANPPKLHDPENPNLYQEFFDRFQDTEIDEESAIEFLKMLEDLKDFDN